MAATFNRAATNNAAGNTKWRVLEPPTGTGKTQGLCVYAALTIAKNRTLNVTFRHPRGHPHHQPS